MSDETVAYLRSLPYDQYLQTEHWRSVRLYALETAAGKCQLCFTRERRLDVHHRTYKRLGEELPADLIALCRPCHELMHQMTRQKREERLFFGEAVKSLTDQFRVGHDMPRERMRSVEEEQADEEEAEMWLEAVRTMRFGGES